MTIRPQKNLGTIFNAKIIIRKDGGFRDERKNEKGEI